MTVVTYTVEVEQKGERIDKALSTLHAEWSRTQVATWVKDGVVQVNNANVKVNYKVKEGDIITVHVPEVEELDIVAEDLQLDIVYEDADVLVVNKPRGMVVHPAPGHTTVH